jgi:RNAse (barnase) inhibitor barstar
MTASSVETSGRGAGIYSVTPFGAGFLRGGTYGILPSSPQHTLTGCSSQDSRYNPLAMASFIANEVNDEQRDWIILRDGGVHLYWRQEMLADDVDWLKSNGYKIISFDVAEWQSLSDWESEKLMHESLKAKLSFPDYYGKNLDAIDECILDDLVVPNSGGLALVLNNYDRLLKPVQGPAVDKRSTAEVVLDIFARAVQYHMLFGKRLLILVQSDNPTIQFGRLGGVAARWNHREWLNKNRGL